MKQLSDKFALITGASQGLGRELALAYAREDVRGLALVARGNGVRARGSSRAARRLPRSAD